MKQLFVNIMSAKADEARKNAARLTDELQAMQTVEDIKSKWVYKNYMTKGAQGKKWEAEALKEYITTRINKEAAKKIEETEQKLTAISEAGRGITNISISVEWAKNRTWGQCPKAEVRVGYTDNTCQYFESGRVTGCGYDKESTAIANALNQCPELLHALYTLKDKDVSKPNQDIFGYGSGYGITPYFEGGVGVSCYPRIFEAIGMKWEGISHGKTFDVYQVHTPTEPTK